jgi:hypothetical protein
LKYLLFIIFLFSATGCGGNQEIEAVQSNINTEKVWVFIQLNVKEENNGLESYYYYAKISKKIYQKISQNTLQNGFIFLENVKYWGDNDLIYDYEDAENTGYLIFRIEDISKIDLIKVEPIVGKGIEQFDLDKKTKIVEAVDDTKTSGKKTSQDK